MQIKQSNYYPPLTEALIEEIKEFITFTVTVLHYAEKGELVASDEDLLLWAQAAPLFLQVMKDHPSINPEKFNDITKPYKPYKSSKKPSKVKKEAIFERADGFFHVRERCDSPTYHYSSGISENSFSFIVIDDSVEISDEDS